MGAFAPTHRLGEAGLRFLNEHHECRSVPERRLPASKVPRVVLALPSKTSAAARYRCRRLRHFVRCCRHRRWQPCQTALVLLGHFFTDDTTPSTAAAALVIG